MTTAATINLASFAKDVQAACKLIPAGRVLGCEHIGRKGFLLHAWALGGTAGRFEGMSLEEFKAMALASHRAGFLTLARCDMPEAFDLHDVRRSLVMADTFEFHLVRF